MSTFRVFYKHDDRAWGGQQYLFAEFNRGEKVQAFDCLRRLAHGSLWQHATFTLKRDRKPIWRIQVGDVHLPRGHVTRRHREQMRRELSAIEARFA